jgi:hypothetical protein
MEVKTHIFGAMGEKTPLSIVCSRLRGTGLVPEQLSYRVENKVVKLRVWKMNSDSLN